MKIYIGTDGIMRAKVETVQDTITLLKIGKPDESPATVAPHKRTMRSRSTPCPQCGKLYLYVGKHAAKAHKASTVNVPEMPF